MKSDRVGEVSINNNGLKMEIIEYNGVRDIKIRFFDNNYIVDHGNYRCFISGQIKSPYDKTVAGVGYWGIGDYNLSDGKGEMLPRYYTWKSMLSRCYNENYHKRRPTYIDCTAYEEWHNYQNFAKWYEDNYYEIDGYKMCLDKDILYKGNKIYSPDTCIFVPDAINNIFIKSRPSMSSLPVGVALTRNKTKYKATCALGHEDIHYLGQFDTPEEAFTVYKEFKENHIKQVADKFKDKIPKILYETMYNYEVEPTD